MVAQLIQFQATQRSQAVQLRAAGMTQERWQEMTQQKRKQFQAQAHFQPVSGGGGGAATNANSVAPVAVLVPSAQPRKYSH